MGMVDCLIREWQAAGVQGRRDDQMSYASEVFQSVNRARACWDFNHFFHNSVDMQVSAGDVLQLSGFYDEAETILRVAATEAHWAPFRTLRQEAKRTAIAPFQGEVKRGPKRKLSAYEIPLRSNS